MGTATPVVHCYNQAASLANGMTLDHPARNPYLLGFRVHASLWLARSQHFDQMEESVNMADQKKAAGGDI